jgi:hypothetical protein
MPSLRGALLGMTPSREAACARLECRELDCGLPDLYGVEDGRDIGET